MTADPNPALPPSSSSSTDAPSDAMPASATVADLPLISPVKVPSSPLVRFGGLLGILGCVLGLGVLLVGCAGYNIALKASPGCIGLGGIGILITLIGALF